MTDKILFENGAEIELKYDDKTYSDFTYVEKHIGIADFTNGIFYPGKDYDYGASEMTDTESKPQFIDLIKLSAEEQEYLDLVAEGLSLSVRLRLVQEAIAKVRLKLKRKE